MHLLDHVREELELEDQVKPAQVEATNLALVQGKPRCI
jgi:hypothetical protein